MAKKALIPSLDTNKGVIIVKRINYNILLLLINFSFALFRHNKGKEPKFTTLTPTGWGSKRRQKWN